MYCTVLHRTVLLLDGCIDIQTTGVPGVPGVAVVTTVGAPTPGPGTVSGDTVLQTSHQAVWGEF